MKKLFASAFAFAMLFTAAQAQEITERKRDGHRKHQSAYMKLDLTEEQKQELKSANEDFRKQMEDLKKQDQITVKESRTRMAELKKGHRAKVQSLLTAEQKTKLEEMKKEGMKSRKGDMKRKSGKDFAGKKKGGFEKMKTDLGLTEDQLAKLKSGREASAAKMKALREDKSLTEEARKEKVKELRKAQMDEFKSVLTEEQKKKLEEQRKERARKSDRKQS